VVALHGSDHFCTIPLLGPSTIPSCPTTPTARDQTGVPRPLRYRPALERPPTVLGAVVVDRIQGRQCLARRTIESLGAVPIVVPRLSRSAASSTVRQCDARQIHVCVTVNCGLLNHELPAFLCVQLHQLHRRLAALLRRSCFQEHGNRKRAARDHFR